VLGVARTDEGAKTLAARGVEPHRGEFTDHQSFISGAQACDGVIHCAFIHDFSRFAENAEIERQTVAAMLEALEGSNKPFIATSGVALLAPGRYSTEEDNPPRASRGETEWMVREAAGRGIRSGVVRLPPTTYEDGAGGFAPVLVDIARQKGVAAYIGDGANRWSAGHRRDAAHLYRLILERGEPGRAYHAVGDEGVPTRDMAGVIGKRLGVPTKSLSPDEAGEHFGWMGLFASVDMPSSSQLTQEWLGWRPTHPGLIADMENAPQLGGSKVAV
jgi:nucleoside-diphosphate-sugar epimerase